MYRMIIPSMLLAFVLDLLVGDPHWLYHPVRFVGLLISVLEKQMRRAAGEDPQKLRRSGVCLAVLVCGITTGVVWGITTLSWKIHPACGFIVMTLLEYFLFAVKSLKDESTKVERELEKGDLEKARYAVSMIVGRDTQSLSAEGVAKAAVETVAENTSDGIIAPMLYMAIGGPVLGWCYKSINTMDSMIGYKNDRYLHLGRFAAKLDDVVNYIPARLSGLLMVISCPLVGLDAKEALRIFKRDRYNHASPNSAQTEAVMAGALHVQLAGDASYFGKIVHKKTIGDPGRPIEARDITRANRLLYAVSVVSLVLFLGLRALAIGC